MTASDEFMANPSELLAVLTAAAVPEIVRLSGELGVDCSYSAHAFTRGEQSPSIGPTPSTWSVRAIFRAAHAPGRVLVQIQAKLTTHNSSGYSGFVVKGAYDSGNPSRTFSARSRTNEYNVTEFRAWT